MSGNWVQRGACAAADKWTRAGWALAGGADLVLELPTVWAASSAESFATGGRGPAPRPAAWWTSSPSAARAGTRPPWPRRPPAWTARHTGRACSRFLDEGMPFAACRQAVVAALLGSERAKVLLPSQRQPGGGVPAGRLRPGLVPPGAGGPPAGSGPRRPAPCGGLRLRLHPPGVDRRRPAGPGRLFPARPLAGGAGSPPPCPTWSVPSWPVSALMSQAEWAAPPGLRCGGGAACPARPGGEAGPCLWRNFYTLAKTKRYSHARLRRLACCGPSWA